jgi:hypothetical protein
MPAVQNPVRLRIAGIYYDEVFSLDSLPGTPAIDLRGRNVPAKPTIFELLEAAFLKPGRNKENFTYVFERRGDHLSITSLGVTHKKNIVGTLGGKSRAAGTYQLTEIGIPGGVVAWQYYVYRAGVSASQLPAAAGSSPTGYSPVKGNGTGFTGFDQFELQAGDEVIWRQVAILREPNVPTASA